MNSFVKEFFNLEIPDAPGQPSLAAQMRQVERVESGQLFTAPSRLSAPAEIEYLFETFLLLNSARSAGWSLNPISFVEIQAWSSLHSVKFDPWEIGVLRSIDSAYLEVVHAKDAAAAKKKKK